MPVRVYILHHKGFIIKTRNHKNTSNKIRRVAQAPVVNKELHEEALKFAQAANAFIERAGIAENGCGYINTPTSSKIRAAIDANFITVFNVPEKDTTVSQGQIFILSRDYKGKEVQVEQKHMPIAIGRGGKNISRIARDLRRSIRFEPKPLNAVETEVRHEQDVMNEIRRISRQR